MCILYTYFKYMCVCHTIAEQSSKDFLVTANNSVGFYVLCSHILSASLPLPSLSVSLSLSLLLSLCLSLCLPAAFACFLWN